MPDPAPTPEPKGQAEERRYVAAQKPLDAPDREVHAYNVRQMLNAAMRALRDCEDYARLTSDNQPLADRCRELHTQLTEDVMNGRTTMPSAAEMNERVFSVYKEIEARYEEANDGPKIGLGEAKELLWNIL